jgi:hypothetical protein
MDLNEARRVIWMRPLRRPLGELFDESYLDRGRLEWAVKNAFDPKVQQAAGIILAWLTQSGPRKAGSSQKIIVPIQPQLPDIDVKISIDQARATLWTWPPFKGQPMGPLVDTRQLTIKDLGSAIEKVWDQRVKEAAIVLMAIRLNQTVNEPEPSKGYLHVVAKGRSFSERKQLQMVLLEGLIYGLSLGIAISYLFYLLFIQEHPKTTVTIGQIISNPLGIVALIFVICLLIGIPLSIGLVVEGSEKVLDKKVDNYRKGQEGENRVDDVMNASLNGEWTLFRNVTLPGRGGGDLDSILVGPAGVWVLEIKTLSGVFRNIGDQWECRTGKKWELVKKNPSRQAKRNAARLAGFLEADGINQWVKPAVVWANPESALGIENPSVAVWKLDRLPDELGNISDGRNIPEDDQQKIIKKLTRLVERQK